MAATTLKKIAVVYFQSIQHNSRVPSGVLAWQHLELTTVMESLTHAPCLVSVTYYAKVHQQGLLKWVTVKMETVWK